jgi:hypothetical protein
MVAVTIGADRLAAADAGPVPAVSRKSFLTRVYEAFTVAQMKRAERELARYRHLLPPDFKLQRDLWTGREDKSPSGGW